MKSRRRFDILRLSVATINVNYTQGSAVYSAYCDNLRTVGLSTDDDDLILYRFIEAGGAGI